MPDLLTPVLTILFGYILIVSLFRLIQSRRKNTTTEPSRGVVGVVVGVVGLVSVNPGLFWAFFWVGLTFGVARYLPGTLMALVRTGGTTRRMWAAWAQERARRTHLKPLAALIEAAEDRFVTLSASEVTALDRAVLGSLYRSSRTSGARPGTVTVRTIADDLDQPPGDTWVALRRLTEFGLAELVYAPLGASLPSWGGAVITDLGSATRSTRNQPTVR